MLTVEDREQALMAILNYGLNGEEPENISTIAGVVYTMAKPQLDANQERKENGRKGGRPKKTIGFENENHRLSDEKPNVNVNVNVNENVNKEKRENAQDLINESKLSEKSKEALTNWVQYKKERRENYKPQGLRSLITQMEKLETSSGADMVVNSINNSMANGYKGIFPAKDNRQQATSGNKFKNFQERDYDMDDLESKLLGRREI